jgi:protein involved in polysaccharide export with SLBB domain
VRDGFQGVSPPAFVYLYPSTPPRALMIRSTISAFTLLLLAVSCSTAKGPALASIAPVVNATLRQGENVIEPGDLIQVRLISEDSPGVGGVSTDPAFQLNQDIRVQADGRASFIGLDDMPVAGLLPAVLDEILTGRYTGLLDEEPILSVVVAEQAARTVTVFGEVANPGLVIVPPDGHLTLVDALGRAGGPSTRTAWLSNTLLVRWDPMTETQLYWKIDARRRHWASEETIILQPRDILFVPNTNIDRVDIWVDNFMRRMIPLPNIFPTVN